LGRIDHAVGGFVGILKAAFMASVALWIISSLASGYTESWEEDAVLYPIIVDFAPVTISWMGEWIPAFKDIFYIGWIRPRLRRYQDALILFAFFLFTYQL